jgi:hypothetical protein
MTVVRPNHGGGGIHVSGLVVNAGEGDLPLVRARGPHAAALLQSAAAAARPLSFLCIACAYSFSHMKPPLLFGNVSPLGPWWRGCEGA